MPSNDSADDSSSTVRLSRRRLLGGAVLIGAGAAGAGAGTFALFSDTESSVDNTIQAGTLDLVVSDADETAADGVSQSFTLSNAKPGETTTGNVDLNNAGSLAADHVEFAFSYTETEADGPGGNNGGDSAPMAATGMASLFEVTTLSYDGSNVLGAVSDANGNGFVDLEDLANAGVFDDMAAPSGSANTLSITLEFVDTADAAYSGSYSNNDFQGDEVTVTVDAALAQDASQDLL